MASATDPAPDPAPPRKGSRRLIWKLWVRFTSFGSRTRKLAPDAKLASNFFEGCSDDATLCSSSISPASTGSRSAICLDYFIDISKDDCENHVDERMVPCTDTSEPSSVVLVSDTRGPLLLVGHQQQIVYISLTLCFHRFKPSAAIGVVDFIDESHAVARKRLQQHLQLDRRDAARARQVH